MEPTKKPYSKTENITTPEGYFDALEQRLLQIPEKSKKPKLLLRIAAAVVLVVGVASAIAFVAQNKKDNQAQLLSSNTIADDELLELNWYQLASELNTADEQNIYNDITDDAIIEYLSTEGIELSEIESVY